MVSITVYGGAGEIGGNQVLVKGGQARLLFDFGSRMGFDSTFFSDFLNVRPNTSLHDRLAIGSLPRIPGIYRADHMLPPGYDVVDRVKYPRLLPADSPYLHLKDLETYEEHKARAGKGGVHAVFVSHAHLDHTGMLGFLHQEIPLICSHDTAVLIKAIDAVTAPSFRTEAITSKLPVIKLNGPNSTFPDSPRIDNVGEVNRECRELADGGCEPVEGAKVTLIAVDHSVPGAASFVCEIDGKRILYTGDIRFHGTLPMKPKDYAKKVGPGIDIMICEGTRIGCKTMTKEADVLAALKKRIKDVKGLVFVDFSWKDTTRYETVRKAAKSYRRTLVINAKLAYLLKQLNAYPDADSNVKVFLKRKESALYSPADYVGEKYEYGLSTVFKEGEEKDSTHYDNGVIARTIMDDPRHYMLMLSYFDLKQIFDLADGDGKIPGSLFIKAQCDPFSDEMEIDEERLINWLETFGIGYDECEAPVPAGCENTGCPKLRARIDRAHVSGHASRPELQELISRIGPKTLIPIHTDDVEAFRGLCDDIRDAGGPDIELRIPVHGEEIAFP